MGVDYNALYGIGYEVVQNEALDLNEYDDELYEYIACELGEGFDYFTTGNDFIGRLDEIYITLKDPFKNGLDLTYVKIELEEELRRLNLTPEGEFGVVGGLHIW